MNVMAVKFTPGSEVDILGLLAPNGGPFNGADLDGEHFSPKTDFALNWFPGDRPLLWNHGLDPQTGISVVGRIKAVTSDGVGLWMQAQLDASHDYYSAIKELIKQGKLGLSSGSMRHLVKTNNKTGEILRWPLIEGSLTPTPANPLAEVDFAEAEKHYKSAGLDLPDELKAAGIDLSDEVKAELTTQRRESLDDSDFAYIDADGGRHLPMHDEAHVRNALARFDQTEFDSDEAKRKARKKLEARAKELGVEVAAEKAVSGSYEELMDKLHHAVNPMSPFSNDCWSYVLATFPDHMIVERHEDGESCFWKVAYTVNDMGEVMLGQAEEIEQFPDAAKGFAETPLFIHADMTHKMAVSLLERTKDLQERRLKEGRMISSANRKRLMQSMEAMRAAMDEMESLMSASEPQAKASAMLWRLRLLQLAN